MAECQQLEVTYAESRQKGARVEARIQKDQLRVTQVTAPPGRRGKKAKSKSAAVMSGQSPTTAYNMSCPGKAHAESAVFPSPDAKPNSLFLKTPSLLQADWLASFRKDPHWQEALTSCLSAQLIPNEQVPPNMRPASSLYPLVHPPHVPIEWLQRPHPPSTCQGSYMANSLEELLLSFMLQYSHLCICSETDFFCLINGLLF